MECEAVLFGEWVQRFWRNLAAASPSILRTHTLQNVVTFIFMSVRTFNFTNKDFRGGFFRLIHEENKSGEGAACEHSITYRGDLRNLSCIKKYTDNSNYCTCKVKSRISVVKAELNRKKIPLTSKFNLDLRKKPLKRYICGIGPYCAQTWRLRKILKKHLQVLKWGLGGGLNKWFRPNMWETKYCMNSKKKVKLCI